MDYEHIGFEVVDGIATVTFNRPDKLNALTYESYREFMHLTRDLPARPEIRVLIVRGAGASFCAGGDVHEIIGDLLERDTRDHLEFTRMTGAVVQNMREAPQPIIAQVRGRCFGAGSVIALAADIRVCGESSTFGFLFTKVGLTGADMGAAYLLPRVVGFGRASEILLLGDSINSDEAYRIGLANRVLPDADVATETLRIARRLASGPKLAQSMTKKMLQREQDMDFASAIEAEAQAQALLLMGADHREFYNAWNEGRAAQVDGEVSDFSLRPRDEEAREKSRRLAREVVAPIAREADATRTFPRAAIDALAAEGILGAALPTELGGLGWDPMQLTFLYEEMGRVDQSVRGFLSVHLGLVCQCLHQFASEGIRARWLPELASGRTIGAYALTERGAGSDAGALTTRAHPDGDGWRISGEKVWITNALSAGVFIVFATVNPALRHKGVTAFLVPGDAEGLSRAPMPGIELGHRSSEHATLTFDGVRIGPADVVGEIGGGFTVAMGGLDHGRVGVAAGAVGLLQACLDATIAFTRDRRQFGQRLADFQMVQERVADMACDTEAARLLTHKAAWMACRGEKRTKEVSMAKLFATEAARRWAAETVALHGSRGYVNELPVERYYRDAPALCIYEGTSQIQRIVIARAYLGREERRK